MVIVKPIPIAAIGGTYPNVARLLTPDPKEAAVDVAGNGGGQRTIDIDLGSAMLIDTFFLGFTNDPGTQGILIQYGVGDYSETNLDSYMVAPAYDVTQPRHLCVVANTPVTARYIRLYPRTNANYSIGTVAIGLAFRPTFGQEVGEGRVIDDSATIERLPSGGFGIEEGAITTGWGWTLGDIQPAELAALYTLVRSRGLSRTVLVIEDPDQTAGLNERIHWGLFRKLSQYERLDPLNTKWDFSIWDWS